MESKFQIASNGMKRADVGALSNEQMLELYGLFKQASVGDVNTSRPGMLSLDLKAKAKWDAWNSRKGMTKEQAQAAYVEVAKRYLPEDVLSQL